MKKMIFAAIVAAFALVSCSENVARSCYKVEYTIPEQPEVVNEAGEVVRKEKPEFKFEGYKWASESEIDACRKNWESMGYMNVLTTKVEQDAAGVAIKTMADCLGQSKDN